jgi:Cdc6-like AAA superfamily ATPase
MECSAHDTISITLGSSEHYKIAYKVFKTALAQRVQKDTGRTLVMDEQIEAPMHAFVAWLINHTTGMAHYGMNPKKGILLQGNVGSGKSVLFRTLRDLKQNNDEAATMFKGMKFTQCETVAKIYQKTGDAGLEEYVKGVIRHSENTLLRNYCFDDLGNEEPKNYYGNYREVMKDIITARYDDFLDHGLITCFTTNLTMDEIEKRYDKRTRSRLSEMCNIIGIGTRVETYKDRRIS